MSWREPRNVELLFASSYVLDCDWLQTVYTRLLVDPQLKLPLLFEYTSLMPGMAFLEIVLRRIDMQKTKASMLYDEVLGKTSHNASFVIYVISKFVKRHIPAKTSCWRTKQLFYSGSQMSDKNGLFFVPANFKPALVYGLRKWKDLIENFLRQLVKDGRKQA